MSDLRATQSEVETELPDEVEPVLDAASWLKVLLADLVTLKFRAHGFHWNVTGPQFTVFHELFADVYAQADALVDPVAEQIRKLGPVAPGRIEDFAALTSLDDSPQLSQEPIVLAADLQERNSGVLDTLMDAYYAAETQDEPGLCAFLSAAIDDNKKLDWQLRMIVGEQLPAPAVDESPMDEVVDPAMPARSAALTVEKRDGSSVSLRTMGGELRTVTLSEERSMTAPITVDETAQVDGPPVFRGHAAVFDMESQDLGGFRETIARGAFRKAIGEAQDTVALFNHDPNLVLGRTTNNTLTLREDPRGLHAEFEAPDTSFARDIRELVRRGDVSQMSFAFTVAKDDWQERSDGSIVRRVLEVDRLHDVSLVTSPAYLQTDAQSVRTQDLTDDADTTLEPSSDAASAPDSAHEAREAQLLEQQQGAKRRLTLLSAKHRMKG